MLNEAKLKWVPRFTTSRITDLLMPRERAIRFLAGLGLTEEPYTTPEGAYPAHFEKG